MGKVIFRAMLLAIAAIVTATVVTAIPLPPGGGGGGGTGATVISAADCSGNTTLGELCVDTNDNSLWIGTGSSVVLVPAYLKWVTGTPALSLGDSNPDVDNTSDYTMFIGQGNADAQSATEGDLEYVIAVGYNLCGGAASEPFSTNGGFYENFCFGYDVFQDAHGGAYGNIGIGMSSAIHTDTGQENVVVGTYAFDGFSAGADPDQNIVIGDDAGSQLSGDSDKNIIIGYSAGPATPGAYSLQGWVDIEENDTPLMHFDFTNAAEIVTVNGDLTVTDVMTTGTSATPNFVMDDTDSTFDDTDIKVHANATDTGNGTEDTDLTFQQLIGGTLTDFLVADADGNVKIGSATQPVQFPGDVYGGHSQASISDNTATAIFTITVPANGYCSVHVDYLATATDATDYQSHAGEVNFTLVSKGAVVTCDESPEVGEAVAVSSGTYTSDTWTCADGGSSPETINFLINSSLAAAPDTTLYYQTLIMGSAGCAITH
jgi:hypothetical protein